MKSYLNKGEFMKRVIILATLFCGYLSAEVTATDVESKYTSKSAPIETLSSAKQSINFGFASTSGNSKSLNLNAKYTLAHMISSKIYEPFKYNLQATAFLTESESVKTAEEYTAILNGEQELKNSWLGYGSAGWLRNEFKNYDNKFSLSMGIGRILFDDGKHKVVIKIGPAYNIEQYTDGQRDKKYGSLNEYLQYTNQLNKSSLLYLKFGAMENFDDLKEDYELTTLIGLNFAISEAINIAIEGEWSYDNMPPIGFKKSDTKNIVRVGYSF